MGTQCRIVLYAVDEATAKQGSDAAFARIAELDRIMSDYKDDSELMQLCKQAGGPAVTVSDDLHRVLLASQQLAEKSGGAFDVTCGPLVRLWRRARRQRELPDEKRLAEARALVGWDKLIVHPQEKKIRLTKPGMLLDLGGIAKGYAADEALAELTKHGIASAMVACGGDIAVSAPPPGSEGWTIGVASFGPDATPKPIELLLKDAAVSTSGDAEQFVEIGGERYSHIIDPRSGMALKGRSGVTVVARRGMESDGLDTALSVLGPERGIKLIDEIEGAAALIVQWTETGQRRFESMRWKDVSKK